MASFYKLVREYSINTYPAQYAINNARSAIQPYFAPKFEATQICTGVYIGNFESAANKAALQYHGIKHIVVAAYGLWEMFPDDFTYKRIDVIDSEYSSLRPYFQEVADYIYNIVTKGEKVLVHCVAGVSRSASLVVAYLILTQAHTLNDAIKIIKSSRPKIQPNDAFLKELSLLSPQLYSINIPSSAALTGKKYTVYKENVINLKKSLVCTQSQQQTNNYQYKDDKGKEEEDETDIYGDAIIKDSAYNKSDIYHF